MVFAAGTPVPTTYVDLWQDWPLAKMFPSLGSFTSHFFPKLVILASAIFFILIVIAGIGVIHGAGSDDPQTKEKTKQFLTYAVIGLIIVFGSYWILQIINFLTTGALQGIL